MAWNLTKIIATVRKLSAKPSANQISDADIIDEINTFYQLIFPQEVYTKQLDAFYDLTTAASTGEYTFPTGYVALTDPVWSVKTGGDDAEVRLYLQSDSFFGLFPHSDTAENEPNAVYIKGNTIYVRPIPDGIYTIKFTAILEPEALAIGTDTPIDEKWGKFIAYGAAIALLEEDGNFKSVQQRSAVYNTLKSSINHKYVQRTSPNEEVVRSF